MFVEQLQYILFQLYHLFEVSKYPPNFDLSHISCEAFLLEIFNYLKFSANHPLAFAVSKFLFTKENIVNHLSNSRKA